MIKQIRPQIEKLILWLAPLIVLSAVAESVGKVAFQRILALSENPPAQDGPLTGLLSLVNSPSDLMLIVQYTQSIPLLLVHVVIGVWLYMQTSEFGGRKWLWLVGGICLSYWAIMLYLFSLVLSTETSVSEDSTRHSV